MTITINSLNVADNAPPGTVVGVLTVTDANDQIIPSNFMLTKRSGGYFAISGNNLITVFTGSITPGYYSVRVRANGIYTRFNDSATFTITVGVPQPTPPTLTGVTFTPSTASLPDNVAAGSTVAAVAVAMSDGSAFAGSLAASPAGTVAISGNKLVLARGLTSADDGSHPWSVAAAQNGVTISGTIPVQVTAASPPPPPPPPPPVLYPTAITVTPANSTIADSAPAGTLLATATVTMSDGSQFTGALTTSDTSFFAISGLNIVTARALTSADDGPHTTTITAQQGGQSLATEFSI
jgi:hypothetical protein